MGRSQGVIIDIGFKANTKDAIKGLEDYLKQVEHASKDMDITGNLQKQINDLLSQITDLGRRIDEQEDNLLSGVVSTQQFDQLKEEIDKKQVILY